MKLYTYDYIKFISLSYFINFDLDKGLDNYYIFSNIFYLVNELYIILTSCYNDFNILYLIVFLNYYYFNRI